MEGKLLEIIKREQELEKRERALIEKEKETQDKKEQEDLQKFNFSFNAIRGRR